MSHQVRLEDHVYERIRAAKYDDESFSEAVERLISGPSLRDLRDVFGEDQIAEMRDAIEAADSNERNRETLEQRFRELEKSDRDELTTLEEG